MRPAPAGPYPGLPDFGEPTTVADLYSWPAITARLAAQAPQWTAGTDGGYHSITFGFLLGEVVRRVTGRDLGTFFAEEVAAPLDGRTCSWGGWGGSLVYNDFDRRMTVSYVMNRILWDDGYARALSIVFAAIERVAASRT
ncbi:MAG TPA: serine hydrolase domain-containing protein [Candidatus Limnocylindrales bacterium]|nr:serine hydrolase domain-containing protein [Candidatus Limnocylindrales bacterium]